ncbi:ERF family protein [Peptacetobacter hiranonis]|uniref:Erf family protein n=1 Tax=Peptacetobacter hiranonis (strain DSM 13275 / JCM 10541 / KCTC 15199 / TO-931) TaxID=500633 RepID=B6FZW5_PEPHT|nr:ERF family protein [Peptacetobacter hiranonis]EEA84938.1 Erf family protein [Peptacetobacter hiranonis DSM 13275]QEK20800.1 hypothetical protein KGNDJEFE_01287 [Peptacetobacter hiranonis]
MSEEVKEVVEEVKKLNVWQKLNRVQVELKAPKNQWNKFGKYYYRSCEDILEGLKPLLDKYNAIVLLSDETKVEEGRHYIVTTATFVDTDNGENVCVKAQAREDENKKGMDGAQLTGSTSSYARKYALNGLFCIDDTKDADATNDRGKAATEDKKNIEQPNKVTNQHLNKLFGLAIRKGVDQSTVRKQISKAFNKTAEEMTLTEYERVVAGYEKMKEKE